MPVTETTLQFIGWTFIVLALALVIFTAVGGWRLPVKHRKIERWANVYGSQIIFYSTKDAALKAAINAKFTVPDRVAVRVKEV